jgi:hypothetical protein
MSWWLVLSLLCRVVGLVTWAETLMKKHEQVIQARGQADDPITNEEEIGGFGDDW